MGPSEAAVNTGDPSMILVTEAGTTTGQRGYVVFNQNKDNAMSQGSFDSNWSMSQVLEFDNTSETNANGAGNMEWFRIYIKNTNSSTGAMSASISSGASPAGFTSSFVKDGAIVYCAQDTCTDRDGTSRSKGYFRFKEANVMNFGGSFNGMRISGEGNKISGAVSACMDDASGGSGITTGNTSTAVPTGACFKASVNASTGAVGTVSGAMSVAEQSTFTGKEYLKPAKSASDLNSMSAFSNGSKKEAPPTIKPSETWSTSDKF